jgi:hypothetical protein
MQSGGIRDRMESLDSKGDMAFGPQYNHLRFIGSLVAHASFILFLREKLYFVNSLLLDSSDWLSRMDSNHDKVIKSHHL